VNIPRAAVPTTPGEPISSHFAEDYVQALPGRAARQRRAEVVVLYRRRNRQIRRRETVTVPGQDGLHGDDRVRSDKLIETVRSAYARNVLTSGYPKNRPIELDL
jgi:hypothetical protein